MRKLTRTIFVSVFALLLAGTAFAATGDQPVTETEPAAAQAVEQAETVTTAVLPATQAPLLELEQDPREPCGPVYCPPHLECCNSLQGICVEPGEACILGSGG